MYFYLASIIRSEAALFGEAINVSIAQPPKPDLLHELLSIRVVC